MYIEKWSIEGGKLKRGGGGYRSEIFILNFIKLVTSDPENLLQT